MFADVGNMPFPYVKRVRNYNIMELIKQKGGGSGIVLTKRIKYTFNS